MSPTSGDDDTVDGDESGGKPEEAAVADATQKQAAKRRTKTGCLTCRKRRIKCGEEKPVCRNCVKSKRDCAGYVQPLVYKQHPQGPAASTHDSDDRTIPDQNVAPGNFLNQRWQAEQQPLGHPHGFDPAMASPYHQLPFGASYHALPPAPPSDLHYANPPHSGPFYGWQHPSQQPYPGAVDMSGGAAPRFTPSNHPTEGPLNNALPLDPRLMESSMYASSQTVSPQSQIPPAAFTTNDYRFAQEHLSFVQSHQRTSSLSRPHGISPIQIDDNVARHYSVQGLIRHPNLPVSLQSSTLATGTYTEVQPLGEDYEDPDDPFDVEMDEQGLSFQDAANNLTAILDRSGQKNWQAPKPHNSRWTQHQAIATFRPAITQSPLRDERNERIFCHFVEITSQCISIFERHHFSPISAPARTLWNFTIPALALSHAALAHAILALGALHLAKLNHSSEHLAVMHFTYAVRRVGKLLGLPNRRHEIATLATVLILGFYEVLGGDHSRWTLHLSGATRLVMEHDFATMTRTARRMRHGAKARVNQWTAQFALTGENYARVAGIPLALLDDIDWEIDSGLISRFAGTRVDYDHQFQPNFGSETPAVDLTEKDVEDFKTKMDLRWWYCKQDIFQSMVSGDPLLMPFENWIYCPPRGQFGRADNPYATLDHLVLIMARLADFGGKDRLRKQRAVAAQGGQWKPPKWLFGPQGPPGPPEKERKGGSEPPQQTSGKASASTKSAGQTASKSSSAPSANEGRVRQSKPGLRGPTPTGGPPMFGMMPPASGPLQLHSSFQSMDASIKDPAFGFNRERKASTPPGSLEDETHRAFAEFEDITQAFDLFVASLGPEFDPLPLSGPPIATPFGPALMYRNAAIACVWAFYNTGRILVRRLHPEMPPAAMVAAGVTAHLTRDYAQSVGKICAGLYSTQQYGQSGALDPSFAGALMESTFSLLFAGVQYSDAGQRGWTISKLKDVERRCGWHTSGAIAAACEIAWERMGQAGKGPPYERTLDIHSKDARISGAGPRLEGLSRQAGQVSDAVTEHESEFVNHDRSLIDRSSSTRVHWALGLLSVEEDIKKMSLEDQ